MMIDDCEMMAMGEPERAARDAFLSKNLLLL
jgi:hypothetical protein